MSREMTNNRTVQEAIDLALNVRWSGQKDEERTYERACQAGRLLPLLLDRVTPSALKYALKVLTRSRGAGAANRALAAVRAALRCAHEEGWCGPPPPLRLNREGPARDYAPSQEEVDSLVYMLEDIGAQEAASLARFLWLTGARLSEALSAGYPESTPDGWSVTFPDTKNGDPRKIALPEKCPLPKFDITRSTFQRRFARARKAAGLDPRLTPHALRHGRITALLAAGVPIPAVAHHVGHRSWKTTQRYAHTAYADSQACAKATS